ncbi:Holliday junction branch migration DNA helicase RuvB [Pseudomonas sp. CFBP 13719]|uniref:Holliday junction branch migration DNA helicase RuvB n=1 Tax=Pseudomonas sp. CFBP 13719 TaxID=2775303 RepID=UPI00406D06F6
MLYIERKEFALMDNSLSTPDIPTASDKAMRPRRLAQFQGQPHLIDQLEIFISAARLRGELIDHCLLYGPPGLGKTTLAGIIAEEMGQQFLTSSGPLLQKPADVVALLIQPTAPSVIFIDEIHRMPTHVEELLYSAMEDQHVDILTDDRRSIRLTLEPFTLIGATTRQGSLSAPLRDRFGIHLRLNLYGLPELAGVVYSAAQLLGLPLQDSQAMIIASRSRGTPRIALKNLRRIRDYFQARGETDGVDDRTIAEALTFMGLNENGLNQSDRDYLNALINTFSGRPVGLNSLAAALGEDIGTLEDSIEPYLIQEGYVSRTSKGRVAMPKAYKAFPPQLNLVG